jgi:hypothetical protein
MFNARRLAVFPLAVISFLGCHAYVDRSQYDALQKESAAIKKQLEDTQDELKKARQSVPGRYQFSR